MLAVSVRTGTGVEAWFQRLQTLVPLLRPAMAVDYDLYAEGEALLGWLNATVALQGPSFDANVLLKSFAEDLRSRLGEAEIAHLKMTFNPDAGLGDIAAVSLVRSDFVPELSLTLDGPAESGQLILNLRVEADPATLRTAVEAAIAALPQRWPGLSAQLEHAEQFRPGRPTPTHRDTHFDTVAA
jgi:hypothetical protein